MKRYGFRTACALVLWISISGSAIARSEQGFSEWESGRLFSHGSGLLKLGRNYEEAIKVFTILADRDPRNISYQRGLACALTSRFAVLSSVLEGRDLYLKLFLPGYEKRHAGWVKAQQEQGNPLRGAPEPKRPILTTIDDDVPWAADHAATYRQLKSVCVRAMESLARLERLESGAGARDRYESAYARGWCLLTLVRYGDMSQVSLEGGGKERDVTRLTAGDSGRSSDDAVSIPIEAVKSAFRSCLKEYDDRIESKMSLAIATYPTIVFPRLEPKFGDLKTASTILEEVAKLDKTDVRPLGLLVQCHYREDDDAAAKWCEKLAQGEARSSSHWYVAGSLWLKPELMRMNPDCFKRAFADLLKGNALPGYQDDWVYEPLPSDLKLAWSVKPNNFPSAAGSTIQFGNSLLDERNDLLRLDIEDSTIAVTLGISEMGWKLATSAFNEDPGGRSYPRLIRIRNRFQFGDTAVAVAHKVIQESNIRKSTPRKLDLEAQILDKAKILSAMTKAGLF